MGPSMVVVGFPPTSAQPGLSAGSKLMAPGMVSATVTSVAAIEPWLKTVIV